ncbi:MAG: tripartite tricarboxylate transporter TctB family protein [Geminicoccaceae bacterium]|nr:tripartite tricarboxylate transporter TctB family protein [Geminicoccaceae bacterium]
MSQQGKPSKPVLADLILPVGAAAYAVYYVLSVRSFPFQAQVSGMAMAILVCLLVSIFLVRTLIGLRRGRYRLGLGDFLGPPESVPNRLLFVGFILAYVAAVPWLGFTLTTFVFLCLSFAVVGVRPWRRVVVVAGTAALVGWLFFIVLLGTRFPAGPFERLMGALF